ncbi:MAG: Hpt domain-containing protein [Leptospiraceae bacterium]|nr:Hpt domain-containing protein [Leptospiraceae bacterium]
MNVDWSRVESLADMDDPDDVEWLKEMIASLIEDLDSKCVEIKDIISKKSIKDLQSILHQIKGVAANFGLSNVQKCSSDGELAAKSGDLDTSIKEASKIEGIWQDTKKELLVKFPAS